MKETMIERHKREVKEKVDEINKTIEDHLNNLTVIGHLKCDTAGCQELYKIIDKFIKMHYPVEEKLFDLPIIDILNKSEYDRTIEEKEYLEYCIRERFVHIKPTKKLLELLENE